MGYVYFPDIIDGIAKIGCLQSDFDQATKLFSASEALRIKIGVVIHSVDQPDYDKHIGLLKNKMSLEKLESAWAEGAKMGVDEVYTYAVEELE